MQFTEEDELVLQVRREEEDSDVIDSSWETHRYHLMPEVICTVLWIPLGKEMDVYRLFVLLGRPA